LSFEQIEDFNKRDRQRGLELPLKEHVRRPFMLSMEESEFELYRPEQREKDRRANLPDVGEAGTVKELLKKTEPLALREHLAAVQEREKAKARKRKESQDS